MNKVRLVPFKYKFLSQTSFIEIAVKIINPTFDCFRKMTTISLLP